MILQQGTHSVVLVVMVLLVWPLEIMAQVVSSHNLHWVPHGIEAISLVQLAQAALQEQPMLLLPVIVQCVLLQAKVTRGALHHSSRKVSIMVLGRMRV